MVHKFILLVGLATKRIGEVEVRKLEVDVGTLCTDNL